MARYSEFEAQQAYRTYQASVTTGRMLTFLEWIIESKVVLTDVPPEEVAELLV